MMRLIRRAVALAALVVTGAAVQPVAPAHAASSRAVIVIGNSTYTVSFNGTITGLQALQLAASVETVGYGQGAAVCKINGVGNPAVPGQCLGETSGQYWSYWRSPPGSGGWTYSARGAGSTTVSDGSVEGWAFGSGSPPPYHSFCDVAGCAPPPPPPPPPTTTPTTSAQSAAGASSEKSASTGDRSKGGNDGGTKGSASESGKASASSDGASSKDDDEAGTESAAGTPSGGRPNIDAGDDGGLSVGTAAAVGVLVGLGATGIVLRRRRV